MSAPLCRRCDAEMFFIAGQRANLGWLCNCPAEPRVVFLDIDGVLNHPGVYAECAKRPGQTRPVVVHTPRRASLARRPIAALGTGVIRFGVARFERLPRWGGVISRTRCGGGVIHVPVPTTWPDSR